MNAIKCRPPRKRAHIVSNSGRIGNEHFVMIADHLLLEVDPAGFELVSAFAEGNLAIHVLAEGQEAGCVVRARSAIYQPQRQRLVISGWEETQWQGRVEMAPASMQQKVVLPTDGSFLRRAMSPPQSEPAIQNNGLPQAA
jgi:hypothetical protein